MGSILQRRKHRLRDVPRVILLTVQRQGSNSEQSSHTITIVTQCYPACAKLNHLHTYTHAYQLCPRLPVCAKPIACPEGQECGLLKATLSWAGVSSLSFLNSSLTWQLRDLRPSGKRHANEMLWKCDNLQLLSSSKNRSFRNSIWFPGLWVENRADCVPEC
jgi:hypothetical protein